MIVRALIIAATVAACIAGALVVTGAGEDEGGRKFTVEFDNAFGLIEGSDVKIAGVRSGQISSLDIDQKTYRAQVGIELSRSGFGDLRTDVFCEARPQSLIGEYFVDCRPGTAPEKLKEGATIPVGRTASTIPVDLVNNIMRRPFRERFSIILGELGAALTARGEDLNETIRRANPALRETDRVLRQLAEQRRTIRDLIGDADRVVGTLADARTEVTRFVREARDTASATADRRTALRAQLQRLPTFLRELRPTMALLGEAADRQRPALANLSASADLLERFLDDLGPFAEASRPAFRTLASAARSGRSAVRSATPRVTELRAFAKPLPELAGNLAPTLEHLHDRDFAVEKDPRSPGGAGFTGFEALLQYIFRQSQATNLYDGNSHLLKVSVFLDYLCANYADAEDAKDPARNRCLAALGPGRPGIDEPDPTKTSARDEQAQPRRQGARADAGQDRRRREARDAATRRGAGPERRTGHDRDACSDPGARRAPGRAGTARRTAPRRRRHPRPVARATFASARNATQGSDPCVAFHANARLTRGRATTSSTSCWVAEAMFGNRGRRSSLIANPVLVGAVTVLIVTIAVFLSYNANQGLPFVPTDEVRVELPNGANLLPGNEVREGGQRIGIVADMEPMMLGGGEVGAVAVLKLDEKTSSVPVDSQVAVRPRSVLGLKYVELIRGNDRRTLAEGDTLPLSQARIPVELDQLYNIFDEETRTGTRRSLRGFGDALTARGASLNQTITDLPRLLRHLEPVARTLADEENTNLPRFFGELADFTRIVAPLSERYAHSFTAGADTFEAWSRDPQAVKDTIERSAPTLDAGIRSFRTQRPFLVALRDFSVSLDNAARELPRTLPRIIPALETGTPVLKRTPELNGNLRRTLASLDRLMKRPQTGQSLRGLTATATTLNPAVRFLGPYITVCNYFNYAWTHVAEHLSEPDVTGGSQRTLLNQAPRQNFSPGSTAQAHPAQGTRVITGTPAHLHSNNYSAAVNDDGTADCESGQRGYIERANTYGPEKIVIDPHTPGSQGPTYTGRARVPAGQTWVRHPENLPFPEELKK